MMKVVSLLWLVTMLGVGYGANGEVVAPQPEYPVEGQVVQLTEADRTVTFQWVRDPDVDLYRFNLYGPEEFPDLTGVELELSSGTRVTYSVRDLVTGNYQWTLQAVSGQGESAVVSSFFTVQIGPLIGGDLPAPALMLPTPDCFLLGFRGTATLEWIRIDGAQDYLLEIEHIANNGTRTTSSVFVNQTASSSRIAYDLFMLYPGRYVWQVTPRDQNQVFGETSASRSFYLTGLNGEWDQDQTQYFSPGDLFAFALNWYLVADATFASSDFDANGITNTNDLQKLLPLKSMPRATEGFQSPMILSPDEGETIGSNVTISWQNMPGASGFELLIRDKTVPDGNLTYLINQPGVSTISRDVYLSSGREYAVRVRTFFGGTGIFGQYSEWRTFLVN